MATFPGPRNGKKAVRIARILVVFSGALSAGENQWTPVGPEGGSVHRLAADPQNPSTVYAATCNGIFKTTDGGANWTAMNSGLPQYYGCGGMLAVDPQNTGTVYAAGGNNISKTTNGGANWSAITPRDPGTSFQVVLVAPGSPTTLYASGSAAMGGSGIFKSSDRGVTWTQVSSGESVELLAVDPQNPDVIYGTGPGLCPGLLTPGCAVTKSTDGGANWSPSGLGLPDVKLLTIDPRNSDTLYAVGSINTGGVAPGGQIFKSTDGGANWNPAGLGLPSDTYVYSLAIHPRNPAMLYALIYRSSSTGGTNSYDYLLATSADGAASWTLVTDATVAGANPITIMPDTQDAGTLYLGTSNGILKTTDAGGHWDFVNSGLRAAPIDSMAIDSETTRPRAEAALFAVTFFIGLPVPTTFTPAALFESTKGGDSWLRSGSGLPSAIGGLVADPQHPGTLYVLGGVTTGFVNYQATSLFKSEDAGKSWAEIWSTTPDAIDVGTLAVAPHDPNVLYVGINSSVARSVDGGHTWTESQVALKQVPGACCVSAIAADPQNSDIVYAGTYDDWDGGTGVWKSTDGGVNWVNLIPRGGVISIIIDPGNPSVIYVNGGALTSIDGGQTWTIKSYGGVGTGSDYCDLLAIDAQNSNILYCGAYGTDVFRSVDAGASWTEVGSGLSGRVQSLTLDPHDPATLYAATTAGLFAITLEPAVVSKRPRR